MPDLKYVAGECEDRKTAEAVKQHLAEQGVAVGILPRAEGHFEILAREGDLAVAIRLMDAFLSHNDQTH